MQAPAEEAAAEAPAEPEAAAAPEEGWEGKAEEWEERSGRRSPQPMCHTAATFVTG